MYSSSTNSSGSFCLPLQELKKSKVISPKAHDIKKLEIFIGFMVLTCRREAIKANVLRGSAWRLCSLIKMCTKYFGFSMLFKSLLTIFFFSNTQNRYELRPLGLI